MAGWGLGALLTALSRNFFCSGVSGRRRLADDEEVRASGLGSVLGGADEVVIEACWVLACPWVRQGARKS